MMALKVSFSMRFCHVCNIAISGAYLLKFLIGAIAIHLGVSLNGGLCCPEPIYLVNCQFCELPKSYLRVYKQVKSIRLFNKGLTKVFLSEERCNM